MLMAKDDKDLLGRERTVQDPSDWQIMKRKAAFIVRTPTFWAVFMGTWLTFLTTLLLFTYGYMRMPMVCWAFSFFVMVLIGVALAYHFLASRGQMTVSLSIGCLIAVILGTILGLYCYDTGAIFPMFYYNARKYTNVVSSEPSAAIADAGKITFNQQTRVAVNKSVGFTAENGMVFCVAPVMDASKQPRIEYWAAGIDCCSAAGEFHCDAANNPSAQGGVVVFDNNGWFFPSRFPYYQKARAKAEAVYMLQSVGEPIFVRWVEKSNLDYLRNYYATRSIVNVIGMSVIMLILSALLSFGLWQPRSDVSSAF
jgi:hypothetical protein